MFDDWGDVAKAVFNPAASTYDMIMEADEGIRQHTADAKKQKREQAQKDAEAAAKLADKQREEQKKEAAHEKELQDKYGKEVAEDILNGDTTEAQAAAETPASSASPSGVVSIPSGSTLSGMSDNSKVAIGVVVAALIGYAVYKGSRRK